MHGSRENSDVNQSTAYLINRHDKIKIKRSRIFIIKTSASRPKPGHQELRASASHINKSVSGIEKDEDKFYDITRYQD